jgi:hypothetical protein
LADQKFLFEEEIMSEDEKLKLKSDIEQMKYLLQIKLAKVRTPPGVSFN